MDATMEATLCIANTLVHSDQLQILTVWDSSPPVLHQNEVSRRITILSTGMCSSKPCTAGNETNAFCFADATTSKRFVMTRHTNQ